MSIENDFFAEIGQCITAWAMAEEELYRICHAALGTNRDLTAIVYSHALTIGSRLALVDSLLQYSLRGDQATLTKWSAILSSIRDNLPLRNVIAHKPAQFKFDIEIGEAGKLQFGNEWFEFRPTEFDTRRGKKISEVKIADLQRHRAVMTAIIRGLRRLHAGLPTKIKKARRTTLRSK